ncbi:MAG: GNAT family N-acetyltransferase [Bacteroidota bacterium]
MHTTVTPFYTASEVEQLLIDFEAGILPRERWTHHAHLTVGLWYLVSFPKEEAMGKVRQGIMNYNRACGIEPTPTSGYHESITLFWLWAVGEFLAFKEPGIPIEKLVLDLFTSPFADRNLPFNYFSKAHLMSAEARDHWLEPDLMPLTNSSTHEQLPRFEIPTERLRLIPLNLTHLQLLKQSRALMEQHLQLNLSDMRMEAEVQSEMDEALETWITHVGVNEMNYLWFTNWEVVLKQENVSIGGIGFVGMPDDNGAVLLGYGIDCRHRGNGYATECARRLIEWAFEHPKTRKIIAETVMQNGASQKVLLHNGFVQTREEGDILAWELTKERFADYAFEKKT